MTVKPILFSDVMVTAILNDLKTQTRRLIKITPKGMTKPKYKAGDILYVRESHMLQYWPESNKICYWFRNGDTMIDGVHFKFNGCEIIPEFSWKPNIHHPRKAARIWLEVIDQRSERLQSITEADCLAEGIARMRLTVPNDTIYQDYSAEVAKKPDSFLQLNVAMAHFKNPFLSFKSLWESINGIFSWNENPMVYVYTFKVLSKTGKPENIKLDEPKKKKLCKKLS